MGEKQSYRTRLRVVQAISGAADWFKRKRPDGPRVGAQLFENLWGTLGRLVGFDCRAYRFLVQVTDSAKAENSRNAEKRRGDSLGIILRNASMSLGDVMCQDLDVLTYRCDAELRVYGQAVRSLESAIGPEFAEL